MSVIQRIRDRAAWLIFGAIALAMIGFIVTDAFQGGGGGLFSGRSTTYAKVNGKAIDYDKYLERVKLVEDQYGGQLNDFMRQQTNETVWNQMIDEIVLGKVYNKLGLFITDKEINDALFGKNPPPQLRQQFTDSIGQYNVGAADQAIREFKRRSPQQYQNFINSIIQNRQREKYTSMLDGSSYIPKWMAEKIGTDNSLMAKISYVQIPYMTIKDSAVKVTDDDIRDFLKEHSEEYKQDKSRSIAYVAFNAAPSAADSAAIRERLQNLSTEFASTTDLKGFLLRNTSELPLYEGFISKNVIQVPNKDSILATPVGGVAGPYLDQNNYVIAKMVDTKRLPDTVKFRHILIATHQRDPQTGQLFPVREDSTAKRIADSIQIAIRNGTNFDSLVVRSDDGGSKEKKGVYDSVPSGQMMASFNDYIFTNSTGSKGIVKTDYGYHYVEILAQRGNAPAYKIAYLGLPIVTSPVTDNAANGAASQFTAESRTAKQFDDNVTKQGLQKLIATNVRPGSFEIQGLGSSRELVRWMYQADVGDVVDQAFPIGDKYVVAMLTEINDEGVMSPQAARPQVEAIVRNHKKAQQLIEKIGKPASLEAVATANGVQVLKLDSVIFAAPFIQNVGQELKVIGASFHKQSQGKVLGPIEGNSGVFVIKPESTYARPNPSASVENTRVMLENRMRGSGGDPIQALRKAATIKDYRDKF